MFAWRRNTGGDEFLLLTRGREHKGTLGFLASIHRGTMPAFSREVRSLLQDPSFPTIGFRAGVVEVTDDDAKIVADPEISPRREQEIIRALISRAEKRCYLAQEKRHNLRVIWHNMTDYEEIRDISANLAELNVLKSLDKLRALLASLKEHGSSGGDLEAARRLEDEWRTTQYEVRDILTLCYTQPSLSSEDRGLIYSPWRDLNQ